MGGVGELLAAIQEIQAVRNGMIFTRTNPTFDILPIGVYRGLRGGGRGTPGAVPGGGGDQGGLWFSYHKAMKPFVKDSS